MAKGDELLKSEPLMMKTIIAMCSDNNWKIRMWAAQYLADFLKELHKYKPTAKKGAIDESMMAKGPRTS